MIFGDELEAAAMILIKYNAVARGLQQNSAEYLTRLDAGQPLDTVKWLVVENNKRYQEVLKSLDEYKPAAFANALAHLGITAQEEIAQRAAFTGICAATVTARLETEADIRAEAARVQQVAPPYIAVVTKEPSREGPR